MRWGALVVVCAVIVACGDDGNSLNGNGSSASSGNDPPPAGATTAAAICVDTINAYRKQSGLPAFNEWSDVETCSDGEAKSDGSTQTAHGAFPKCGENAQNECPGWPGPPEKMIKQCLDAMWAQGPGEGHHDNMASHTWTKVACGFYTLPNGSVWSVQNFK
jgi:hypothetical protein